MAMRVDRVLAEALALPEGDRAKLVAKLLASLPPGKASPAAETTLQFPFKVAKVFVAP